MDICVYDDCLNNHFLFEYEFNRFSIIQESASQYKFDVSLCHSDVLENRLFHEVKDSCICDEGILESAVNIIKASDIPSHKKELKQLYFRGWDDLILPHLGPFLILDYQYGADMAKIPDKDHRGSPPCITYDVPLYPDVMKVLHDLFLLFFECKKQCLS